MKYFKKFQKKNYLKINLKPQIALLDALKAKKKAFFFIPDVPILWQELPQGMGPCALGFYSQLSIIPSCLYFHFRLKRKVHD